MQILQLLLTLLGAIGIFLFGMKMMSEALQKLAGQRMRSFISTLAQNPVRGIFSGLTVTGALQSSSAATVMVVGLSGAGLLTFREAFSLIMGANIGTTLKAWLISYVGFGYDLNNLALPFVAVGIVLLLSRRVSRKHWGEFLIGFALLFIGIEFLKAQTEVLTSQPGLISFVRSLNNQGLLSMVFFALAGVVLTAILQSSSAMMAFTFAMVSSGWIEYPMAAAMVLGENIGTTVTANIAALVSDSRARRSALSHSLFNVFGVFLAILLFNPFINLIAWFTEWAGWTSPFDSASSIPFALAALHTSFNLINALIWVNFIPQMTGIVNYLIPGESKGNENHRFFNPYIISTAEFSLLQAKSQIAFFSQRVGNLFEIVQKMLMEKDPGNNELLQENARLLIDNIVRTESEIRAYIANISENDLSLSGKQRHEAMRSSLDKLFAISRICKRMIILFEDKDRQRTWFSPKQRLNLQNLFREVSISLSILNANLAGEYHKAGLTEALEQESRINTLRDTLLKKIPGGVEKGKFSSQSAEFYKEFISFSEKIADLAMETNQLIASCRNDQ